MNEMTAAVFDAYGAPAEVVGMRTLPVPQIGAGEVLVKVMARPVQPADFMFIEGRYRVRASFPQVAGLEGAGIVVRAGDHTDFKEGQHVAFRFKGAWAEYAAVPAEKLYAVPDAVPFASAAQFCLNPITAWALLDELAVPDGAWIIANAASSSVVQLVSHIGARRGIRVVGLVRASDMHIPTPYPVLDLEADDLDERIASLTGGKGAAGLLDSVGGSVLMQALPSLAPGATIVSFGLFGKDKAEIGNADIIFKNLTWKGFGIDAWLARQTAASQRQMEAVLWSMIQSGEIQLPVRRTYPLRAAVEAVSDAAISGAGKVLISD
jgi:NADPH:quinone reductase-like Zn-dependent oxidoreductase